MAKVKVTKQWSPGAMDPPNLSQQEWGYVSLLGVLLIVMAVLQLASFNDFKDSLSAAGLSSTDTWGIMLVILELWGAMNFFKIKLTMLFRMVSSFFAILVAGFWFFETIRLVSGDMTTLSNSGFFGRFLSQPPGWWTVLETTIVLFWTFWAVKVTQVKSK